MYNFVLNVLKSIDAQFLIQVLIRCFLAVVAGALIGSERARHGRAAGMRTHILVCLGAALTAMIGLYLEKYFGSTGDLTRISAQVVSGIGFLGAGMIILKSNNVITGLTTAAGVWTTGIIGIALGYGFYAGAIIATVLFLGAIILFAKFERRKKSAEVIYVEIDDMYKVNEIIGVIGEMLGTDFSYHITAPKSNFAGNIGVSIVIEKRLEFDVLGLCEIEHVVFVEEE
ncbi:MAG: MgtC/SapB family protein [Clostridia bacterium]|nr:MgtC/SapB family protein [Clostridia bacterium]